MNSLFQGLQVHVEKDNDATRLQVRHCGMAVHGAAAGCDDVISEVESEKDPPLDRAQGHVTVPVDDLLQGPALLRLDKDIGINEIPPRQFGQKDAYGTLA